MLSCLRAAVLCASAVAATALAQPAPPGDSARQALQLASDAVVGLRAQAVDGAHSARTLGRARQGSGVVIGADGLVLTIGYLILEAEQVMLRTDDGRDIPARVIAYDLATGFGLVQSLTPLKLPAVPLGRSGTLADAEPLMIASGGVGGAISMAQMVSRRPFSGYWEYHVDGAVFTSPPRGDHSGAGLFNGRGELVGIGSLVVADALGATGPPRPGNMFVPIDLLLPILDELRAHGRSAASERAWLGINCVEHAGAVRVVRVNPDSPADVAGLEVGDRVVGIDGVAVGAVEQLWKTLWAGPKAEREVTLEIERDGSKRTVTVFSVDRAKTLRRAQGV
ncbi:MAG: S1C family serine protease [Rubrivivax sp.]|nr:S1C family serine protease [Rubrivivax sp.]